jgi:hypothetical protein
VPRTGQRIDTHTAQPYIPGHREGLMRAWTTILSGLKTLLETGEPMPMPETAA